MSTSCALQHTELTRGTDGEWRFLFKEPVTGAPIPLVNAVIFDQTPRIASRLTLDVTDIANGIVVVTLEGTIPIELGMHSFRVQGFTTASNTVGTQEMRFVVI